MGKIMLVSVGGSTEPIINSILFHKPDKIIFFVSKGSRNSVTSDSYNEKFNSTTRGIMPAVFREINMFIDHEFVVTENHEDIGESTRILLNEVPKAMQKLGVDGLWPDIVDYTGGTKTMSAAMVWASSKFPCQFNYVGGKNRTKDGLGIVIDGNESHVTLQNPWNSLAYFEVGDAMKLFNNGQYTNSEHLFSDITNKVTDENAKRVFSVLTNIVGGYAKWDMFDHHGAMSLIGRNIEALKDIAEAQRYYLPHLKTFVHQVELNFDFLKSIKSRLLSWNMIFDLIANAQRRAKLEFKYEDATARIYSAIEKVAKHQLKQKYGIDNSKCDLQQIPESLQEQFLKHKDIDGKIKFGVIDSYKLLIAFGDIYGKRFAELDKIEAHLTERNYSILGHGLQPINQQKYEALFDDLSYILSLEDDDMPLFPTFSA